MRVLVRRSGLLTLAAVMAVGLPAACSPSTAATRQRSPDRVIFEPEPSTGPYVVVAVDNHFHDIHPVDDPKIHAGQPFVVKNEGMNLHNFTVVGTRISIDLRPGQQFTWSTIGSKLKPGAYAVVCTYHADVGMVGNFQVVP